MEVENIERLTLVHGSQKRVGWRSWEN